MTSAFTSRKCTESRHSEYFVAMPSKAAATSRTLHLVRLQKIAVATHNIPCSYCCGKTVQRALKLETSPCSPSGLRKIDLSARPSFANCIPLILMVRRIPVARINTMSGIPQTKLSTFWRKESNDENILSSLLKIIREVTPWPQ